MFGSYLIGFSIISTWVKTVLYTYLIGISRISTWVKTILYTVTPKILCPFLTNLSKLVKDIVHVTRPNFFYIKILLLTWHPNSKLPILVSKKFRD